MKKHPDPGLIDDDNPEWAEEMFARARPTREALHEIFPTALAAEMLKPKRRGTGIKPRKAVTTLRLPAEALARWKASGPGWQTRMAALLEKRAPRNGPADSMPTSRKKRAVLRKPAPLLLRDAKGRPVSIVSGHSLADGKRLQPLYSAIIYLDRLHTQTHLNAEALRRLFDLTQAEAVLAEVLHEGANLSEACQRLGKSHNTLRTQLRALFGKTNTHRQIDLLRVFDRATRQ